jgi:hypothetical protein
MATWHGNRNVYSAAFSQTTIAGPSHELERRESFIDNKPKRIYLFLFWISGKSRECVITMKGMPKKYTQPVHSHGTAPVSSLYLQSSTYRQ